MRRALKWSPFASRVPQLIRPLLIRATHLPGIASIWRLLLDNRGTIFVLHRFHDEEFGTPGHDPASVRRLLAFLRRERFEILSLRELFRRLEDLDDPLRGAVAFTIDDGYIDQATIGAPIFGEFDCPATIFVDISARRSYNLSRHGGLRACAVRRGLRRPTAALLERRFPPG